ncbi:MAG: hypothetical protein HY824_10950, partial [Acidobacteria bacterium]|nr:hypothetical protein [Acidobacteriota bacterium]
MRNLADVLRRNRRLVVLFGLMVLLPVAALTIVVVRAIRSERGSVEYEKTRRQQQIAHLVEADLTNWLFSAGADSGRATALVRYTIEGERVVFPEL